MSELKPLVDVKFATSQLGGNVDLLKRMLRKFSAEFSQVPGELKSMIASGDIKDAKMKVHTTKGLSGNLGMIALFDCSKLLDQQLREGEINHDTIDAFSDLMVKTCDFIETIDLESKAPAEFSHHEKTEKHKVVFIERLKRREFIDDDTLHQYVDSLSTDTANKQALITLVEELQYEKAIEIINTL